MGLDVYRTWVDSSPEYMSTFTTEGRLDATSSTTGHPVGSYEVRRVRRGCVEVVFTYDMASHVPGVTTRAAGAALDITRQRAQWLRDDLVAWDVPDADRQAHRLHWSTGGDLAVDAEDVTGGK